MFSPSTSPGRDEGPRSYRADAWRVGDAVADDDAIETLEATPVDDLHERAAAMGSMAFVKSTDGGARLASHALVGPLLRRGFRYLGIQHQRLGYFGRFRSHCLIHPDGAVWVTVRAERRLTSRASRYFLVSVFDDGTCVETSSSPEPVMKSSARLHVRAGTNEPDADLDAHLGAVRAHAQEGAKRRILPARTHDDIRRQLAVYVRHALSTEGAQGMVDVRRNEILVLRIWGTLVLGLVFGVLLLARAL